MQKFNPWIKMTVISDLVPYVRTKVGDRSSPYRYEDAWVEDSIQVAHMLLQRYIYNKYLYDDATSDIVRNSECKICTKSVSQLKLIFRISVP